MVKAVDDVSLTLHRGETLGLVGESGCGKSTLGRALLRLIEPTQGEILYNGQDLRKLPEREMRLMRQHMQMVFQNPYSSLNPRMTVLESVRAPLDIFKIGTPARRDGRRCECACESPRVPVRARSRAPWRAGKSLLRLRLRGGTSLVLPRPWSLLPGYMSTLNSSYRSWRNDLTEKTSFVGDEERNCEVIFEWVVFIARC